MSESRCSEGAVTEVSPELLEILVCPITRTGLRYDEEAQELISDAAGIAFPIRRGMPIMLVEEARLISPE
jgi:uncharacterized protein